jgi:hypothetical protein
MTAKELYALLDNADVDFDVIEIFEGVRVLRIEVHDENEEDIEE